MWRRRGQRRHPGAAVAALVAGALATSVLSGCSAKNAVPSIGYAFDNVILTYNANTTAGAASGAAAAFPRVLTGAYYPGPDGQEIADTDYAVAREIPGDTQTVEYKLNQNGVYSDGVPISCDDLVLEWAARSGRFVNGAQPLFDTADTAGYSDIERVDCQAGSKDATVVFRPGRSYHAWRSLFNAAELMPAHVLAKAVGVPNVVDAITAGDPTVLHKLATFWNTGWDMKPGKLDPSLFPSSGPYRIDSFGRDTGLVLVANDRWWGRKPLTGRIVLWPKDADVKAELARHAVDVLDIGAGSVAGLALSGFRATNYPSRNTEQLILATGGALGDIAARKAFAQCVPRQELYDQTGHQGFSAPLGLGSGVLNSRVLAHDDPLYPAVAASGTGYPGGDSGAASATLAAVSAPAPTIRVGYLGPDARRAQEVSVIAGACRRAGITVVDAGSPQYDPRQLRTGAFDAILAGTAGSSGTGGSADNVAGRYALKSDSGSNFGGYVNGRYGTLLDEYAVEDSVTAGLDSLVSAETLLWNEVPTIPLFDQPRTVAFAVGMGGGIPNPDQGGSGWNMDRWVLRQ